jgi:hypothetical protein
MLPVLAIGLIVVIGGCLAVASRNRNLRPLALALACGPAAITGEVVSILVMIAGIVITANHAPAAARPEPVSSPPGTPAGGPGSAGLFAGATVHAEHGRSR